MDTLTVNFPSGPSFANHAVVGWTNHAHAPADSTPSTYELFGAFPSWINTSVDATWATENKDPSATFHKLGKPFNYNAVTGWAICDIVRTVLQQNANQAGRGSCAPTAFLSSLSIGAPVHMLKMALEIFWTGKLESMLPAGTGYPCDFVYDQLPGAGMGMGRARLRGLAASCR